MSIFIIILIGVVQGLAEFLPVSSSGHLVLMYNIFDITQNTILLSVILHLATLFAVIYVYKKDIWQLITHPFCKTNLLLLSATIPTVIIVLLLENIIVDSFGGQFLIIGFLFTAILLIISDLLSKKNTTTNSDILNLKINYRQAVIIGIAQGVAGFPAVSRSGSTIATALILKVNKEDATKFSFLLSIPIIIASFFYELINIKSNALDISTLALFTGFIVAFLCGIFAVKVMTRFVKKQKLYFFSIYLFVLSAFLILN